MNSKFLKKAGAAALSAAMALNGAVVGAATVIAADEVRYEFEDAVLDGVTVESDAGASGGACARMETGGSITLTVNVDKADMYTMTIYAGGIGGAKQQNLSVNGASQGALAIPDSDGFEAIAVPVKLNAGENTVVIEASWGWTRFDYLTVATAQLPEIKATQTTLSDSRATAETRSLMDYLSEVYGSHIISGQQEIYQYGPHGLEYEFEYLENLTGHMPAIRGFDYGNFTCPAFGSDDGSTERVIDWVKNRNGIATASWHLNVPTDMSSYTIGDRIDWSATTYTQNTDFSPSKAATEGTKENEYYMQALTTLAAEFKELEAEGIPIIWRPLHEAEGGGGETGSWFWWGREGSAAYKKLWVYTYETLTETFDVHNLIWEWNSYDFATSADWYPGDEYVDIIGYDKYNCTKYLAENNWQPSLVHDDSAIASTFYSIMERYNSAKMIAMAENDCFSTVENLTSEKAGWLYFCTWYDGGSDDINFLSNPVFNTEQDTIDMYQSEYCITLDELPKNLYTRETPDPDPSQTTTKVTTTATTTTPVVTTTTAADPSKSYGKVSKDSTGKIIIVLPEPSDTIYLQVELSDDISYANGGLGVSIEIDGEYYWANVQWEATKSGDIELNLADNLLNVSLGLDVVEDEDIIEAVKEALANQTTFEGQVWYAADSANKATDTDGVDIIGAYIKKAGTTVDPDILYGDANCDNEVNLADAVLILQSLANPDKYGIGGSEKSCLTEKGSKNADCSGNGDGLTGKDALAIQKYMLKIIDVLPEV